MMEISKPKTQTDLYSRISAIIKTARQNIRKAVNTAMVQTYWSVGQIIVEDEQKGKARAEYGKATLKDLGKRLSKEFGKGFDNTNLSRMRLLYMNFPKCDALRHELSWTHYRLLLKVEDEKARLWYNVSSG